MQVKIDAADQQRNKDGAEQMLVAPTKIFQQQELSNLVFLVLKQTFQIQDKPSLSLFLRHFELLICIRGRPSFPRQKKITTSKVLAWTMEKLLLKLDNRK